MLELPVIALGQWVIFSGWGQCFEFQTFTSEQMAVLCGMPTIQYSTRSTFLVGQRNDLELIPTVKVETSHPIDGSFGSDFLAICNHCRVMAAGSLKTP